MIKRMLLADLLEPPQRQSKEYYRIAEQYRRWQQDELKPRPRAMMFLKPSMAQATGETCPIDCYATPRFTIDS